MTITTEKGISLRCECLRRDAPFRCWMNEWELWYDEHVWMLGWMNDERMHRKSIPTTDAMMAPRAKVAPDIPYPSSSPTFFFKEDHEGFSRSGYKTARASSHSISLNASLSPSAPVHTYLFNCIFFDPVCMFYIFGYLILSGLLAMSRARPVQKYNPPALGFILGLLRTRNWMSFFSVCRSLPLYSQLKTPAQPNLRHHTTTSQWVLRMC